jgi:hypothetical protein
LRQSVYLPGFGQLIHSPQCTKDFLLDFLALSVVFGDLKVAVLTRGLDADEHGIPSRKRTPRSYHVRLFQKSIGA